MTYGGTAGLKVGRGRDLSIGDGSFSVTGASMTRSPCPVEEGAERTGPEGPLPMFAAGSLSALTSGRGEVRAAVKHGERKKRLSVRLSRSGRSEQPREENKANFLLQRERRPAREAHDQ